MSEHKQTMFTAAHERTVESVKYLVYQEKIKTDELNHLATQVLENARMELYVATMEGVDAKELSEPAKKLLENPDMKITSSFRASLEEGVQKKEELEELENSDEEVIEFVPNTSSKTVKEVSEEEEIILDVFSTSTEEPEQEQDDGLDVIEDPIQYGPQLVAIIKNFDKCKPAHSIDRKAYRPAALKPCREVLHTVVLKYAAEQLECLLDTTTNYSSEEKAVIKDKLNTSSVVATMLKSLNDGAKINKATEVEEISKETKATIALCDLATVILANAAEFKQDNPSLLDGKSLTANNITKYYRELGALNANGSKKTHSAIGKEHIASEMESQVYATLDQVCMER